MPWTIIPVASELKVLMPDGSSRKRTEIPVSKLNSPDADDHMTPWNIISLGEVLWDLFPDEERFGGAPANFACHAAILGGQVTMLSAVGDDTRGARAVEILKKYHVDTSLIQILAGGSTGTVRVQVDGAGKPTFTIHENSAWDQLVWTNELVQRIQSADAICFGTLGQRSPISRDTIRSCVEAARAAGVVRVLDINLRSPFYDDAMIRESIQLTSILKLSDEELPAVCRACDVPDRGAKEVQIRALLNRFHLEMVVMTRGADGAMLVTAHETLEQPGIPTTVTDTVGAGDAFTAAFLSGVLRQESDSECLLQACRVASKACSHAGAVPAF
ncbi:MAG: carbohydrate kinase [Planctomycetaceae bacterium]